MENSILTEFVRYETLLEKEYALYVWIGLNKTADNTFVWQPFKRPLTYTNWEFHMPDNYGGNQSCVGLHTKYWDRLREWNDQRCSWDLRYICMKPKGKFVGGTFLAHNSDSWQQQNVHASCVFQCTLGWGSILIIKTFFDIRDVLTS